MQIWIGSLWESEKLAQTRAPFYAVKAEIHTKNTFDRLMAYEFHENHSPINLPELMWKNYLFWAKLPEYFNTKKMDKDWPVHCQVEAEIEKQNVIRVIQKIITEEIIPCETQNIAYIWTSCLIFNESKSDWIHQFQLQFIRLKLQFETSFYLRISIIRCKCVPKRRLSIVEHRYLSCHWFSIFTQWFITFKFSHWSAIY